MTIWSDPEEEEHELVWLTGTPDVISKGAKINVPSARWSDMLGADTCLVGTVSLSQVTGSAESPQNNSMISRPAVPYSQIIRQSLEASPRGKLLLREIYEWFESFHPYYTQENKGWKNSVRHTLSANKQFLRLPNERDFNNKGSEWCLVDSAVGRAYMEGHCINRTTAWDDSMSLLMKQEIAPLKRSQSLDDVYWTSGHQETPPHLLGMTPNPDFSCMSGRCTEATHTRTLSTPLPIITQNSLESIIDDDISLMDVDQIIY